MTRFALVQRSLLFHRGSNLAVIAGVATAVAVLSGALLVGESVRASLRRLALERLGNVVSVVSSGALFREQLAAEIGGAPMLVLEGIVSAQSSNRRASGVAVYGVDDRYWKFQGIASPGLVNRDAAMSQELADELGAKPGDTLLLRLEKPTDIPAESVFGRKEAAPAIRFTAKSVAGDFSLRPQQGPVKALFVPLTRLQKEMDAAARINTIVSARPGLAALRQHFTIEDLGLRLRGTQLESTTGVLSDKLADAAMKAAGDAKVTPIFTYMFTALKANGRETPYSLVTALDMPAPADSIVLSDWATQDLAAKPGDKVTMEYLVWQDSGRMVTERAEFTVAAARGLPADRDLAPRYPGITDAKNVSDWDPPFPMDLKKIRPKDEDYWDKYNTTPKAYIPLARAQQLWRSRWGKLTALRFASFDAKNLRASLDPAANGLAAIPLRELNLAASRGATDFGEYFSYFSFFLMASALMLAGLFFRLGVEQRASEVGLLRAVGFSSGAVRRLFLTEGALLAAVGSLLGLFAAIAYAALVLFGLSTWWVDAVGTRELRLAVSPGPLLGGMLGAMLAALGTVAWTLRGLRDIAPRQLLAGQITTYTPDFKRSRGLYVALVCGVLAVGAMFALPAAAGFFAAGMLLLIAALAFLRSRLAASLGRRVTSLASLAVRNAGYRPGRTVLAAALIASATFLIVSVDAFRRDPNAEAHELPIVAESVRPLYHDLNTAEGRQELNVPEIPGVTYHAFRLRPGDDASCLNLYEPRNPRILGVPKQFRDEGLALNEVRSDGAIPALADANSLQYVLHKKVGEELTLPTGQRLHFVAALTDSVFQSEVLIGEANFLKAFPGEQGYRVFLIDAPKAKLQSVIEQLETALTDYGFDASLSATRLASFHRVENTYLSTFQSLGALGLLLGTVGLAAVLIRNVLERRRELSLLSAVGYSGPVLMRLVLRENAFILNEGLGIGAFCAAIAILPALIARQSSLPLMRIGMLLAAVFATGLAAVWLAARAALRSR
jgi:ABC-type lipoprotein release transport system permease subunit